MRTFDDQLTETSQGIDVLGAILLSGFAWFVFAIGALSPLTPSEGHPGIPELVLFIAVPVLALLGVLAFGARLWIKAAALVQLGLLLLAAYFVLSVVFGWSR